MEYLLFIHQSSFYKKMNNRKNQWVIMTNLATTEATLTDVESLLGKKKHEQRLGYTVWVI